eukprot:CAMPEP_0198728006 /NCGR_PEP_ID=MMETSP1475-20131203/6674_1 /TAXON_ID= ORGANISM="Unidentified sp., Strain CCMP1999" /NCGR_SAMPLE_ID=MMETSP1475 /ASSEMBLY_ACC=CAM_ASM_001111 /LENGTH=142 /DNA_ID=CAMNT_0044490247 /DNA_START=72 /DNA_END=501 /DNA_ORIENTATION=+
MAEDEEVKTEKDKETAKSNKDLDRVTDYVEEREVDTEKFRHSITGILDSQSAKKEEKAKRDKELEAVTIKAEDVEVIMNEMDAEKKDAERVLREHSGSLSSALVLLFSEGSRRLPNSQQIMLSYMTVVWSRVVNHVSDPTKI